MMTAAAMKREAIMPDIVFTAIGVPYLPLKRPNRTGAVRSSDAIAYVRSAPMIQVPPLEARATTKARATIQPSMVANCVGNTLATIWYEWRKPVALDSWAFESVKRITVMGIA